MSFFHRNSAPNHGSGGRDGRASMQSQQSKHRRQNQISVVVQKSVAYTFLYVSILSYVHNLAFLLRYNIMNANQEAKHWRNLESNLASRTNYKINSRSYLRIDNVKNSDAGR